MNDVAEPLFAKSFTNRNNSYCAPSSVAKHAEWFDSDCLQAKLKYEESLRIFNQRMTPASREYFCDCKSRCNKLISQKKKHFESKKLKDIENLKKSKSRDF